VTDYDDYDLIMIQETVIHIYYCGSYDMIKYMNKFQLNDRMIKVVIGHNNANDYDMEIGVPHLRQNLSERSNR
jgi:hypothetical protein